MVNWKLGSRKGAEVYVSSTGSDLQADFVSEGSLKYALEKAGNDSGPSYQEASGAPVEVHSSLGYSVGSITILFLNFSMMVGTGVYSTPSAVFAGTGSVGLALIFWTLGFFISLAALALYLEYASYFPNRSGSEVVYLEQAFPRPKYFFPLTFAVQTVALSFSASNAIVLSEYLWKANGHTPTAWQENGVAIAGYSVGFLLVVFHTRGSLWLSNLIGGVKLITLIFVAITGLVVLGGHTRVKDPKANFRDAFAGSGSGGGYGATTALYDIIFSYAGYANAFNVVNEVKKPIQNLKKSATLALLLVAILYVLANVAYFAAVSKADLAAGKQTVASLFFEAVFGSNVKGLNVLIALSAFGNIIAVLIGQSRLIRECGRQGVLPFPKFWASTRPFGTPFGPYLVKWGLTMIMILAPPRGNAFDFVVDLSIYPAQAFLLVMAVGLYAVRYQRKKAGIGRSDFRAWDVAIIFNILVNIYCLVMPWYPPPGGADSGQFTFWYAAYVVTGIGIIVLCIVYYVVWMYILPYFGKYTVRQETITLDDEGTNTHRLVRVPNHDVAAWDAAHDATGRTLDANVDRAVNEDSELNKSV